MLTAANCTLVIQLLTVATVSWLAQLAMHLAAQTESRKHWGSVSYYTASTGALDWVGT